MLGCELMVRIHELIYEGYEMNEVQQGISMQLKPQGEIEMRD